MSHLKDKCILITGGAGYIGSHTIIDLVEHGYTNVISIDNYSNSDATTFERIKEITGVSIKNYEIDLCDLPEVKKVFKENNIEGVIHFAAHKAVGVSVHQPIMYYKNNLLSLLNLLDCGVENLIFSSSCTVYGQPDNFPVDENFPIIPALSPYGNTKQVGEEIIQDFGISNSAFKSVLLRYFNPVGAHSSGLIGEIPKGTPDNLVPFITQSAIGIRDQIVVFGNDYNTADGSCVRDYIHVMDIAHAHSLALEKLLENKFDKQIEVFNLGFGKGVSVLEVITSFEKISGEKLDYKIGARRKGDIEQIFSDSAKANKELGWSCKYSLSEMMESAWIWEKNLRVNENQ